MTFAKKFKYLWKRSFSVFIFTNASFFCVLGVARFRLKWTNATTMMLLRTTCLALLYTPSALMETDVNASLQMIREKAECLHYSLNIIESLSSLYDSQSCLWILEKLMRSAVHWILPVTKLSVISYKTAFLVENSKNR